MSHEAVFLIIVVFFLYFIPAIAGKHQNNSTKIFWINLFLGWTILGWVVALSLAIEKPKDMANTYRI